LSKLYTKETLSHALNEWRINNLKIVFTNGCFDIIHTGHVNYLNQAKNKGSKLIVGLNSDESVKRLKGNNRPFVNQEDRAFILTNLVSVDAVCIFEEDTPKELIKFIKPDILIKGSDYKPEEIVGKNIVEEYGGNVETINLVHGKSTTNLINKIRGTI